MAAPDLPGVPLVAAGGFALVVAWLVLTTPIGSGDYGQWLMASRPYSGLSTPEYRALGGVPPIVPLAIAAARAMLDDPVLALHVVAFGIVLGLVAGFYAAGASIGRHRLSGLAAAVIGLLMTDRFLELMAFGGLPQAAAIGFLCLAVAAFARALNTPATEARWWVVGCVLLLATCFSHVPTSTIGLATGAAIGLIRLLPDRDETLRERIRALLPLGIGLAVIGAYWVLVIAPASIGFVTNPASLNYRGPERVPDLLAAYPPTVFVIVAGGSTLIAWLLQLAVRRPLVDRSDGRLVLFAWLAAAWAAYGSSAISGTSTDYPRFLPLLLAPFVVAAAAGITAVAAHLAERYRRARGLQRGLVVIGLAILLVAPFSIAKFQTEAHGYELPDADGLAAAATWSDGRLVPGAVILAPVREAKWVEGLTGRSALFSSDIRYAFRPVEWERSLAAATLLRGNLALANNAFVLTLTDGVPWDAGQEPRGLIVAANHGGEYIDLLRLVPELSRIVSEDGASLASLPNLTPSGLDWAATSDLLSATTSWSGTRAGAPVVYRQTLTLRSDASTFSLDAGVDTPLGTRGLELELRPPTGVALLSVTEIDPSTVEVTFARLGRSQPRLRLHVDGGGTIAQSAAGGVLVTAAGSLLRLTVADLTSGAASSTLRLLDPAALVDAYHIGAVILRRDASYDARRARLELLGFHVARAEGAYIVMVHAGDAIPAGGS